MVHEKYIGSSANLISQVGNLEFSLDRVMYPNDYSPKKLEPHRIVACIPYQRGVERLITISNAGILNKQGEWQARTEADN